MQILTVYINICPLKEEYWLLTNRDIDKAELSNALFASVFNRGDRPRTSQCPELDTHGYEYNKFPADPEFVQGLLCQLDPYKSMGPDRIL